MLKLIVVIEDCSEELRKAPSMKYSVNMGSMQPYGKRFPSHMFPCELFNFFSKQLLYRTPVNGCFLPLPFSYICQNFVLKCQTYFTFLALTSNLPSVSYSETCQTCKMEYFAKIVNGFETLTIFAKRSVLDVWQGLNTPLAVTKYLQYLGTISVSAETSIVLKGNRTTNTFITF